MDAFMQICMTTVVAVMASSGFWALIIRRMDKRDAKGQMLMGLAHDRIMFLGLQYIERGWITQSEHENLHHYLYQPYKCLGGNGTADRILQEVHRLPLRKGHISSMGLTDQD